MKMNSRIALRLELENAISEAGFTLSKIQETGGPNIGKLSDILRREGKIQPITMKQLDTLTEALRLPEGHYYDLYLAAECFFNSRLAVPRMKSFLYRCAELGKTELIMKAIHILGEHPKYIELLFSVAENLYLDGLVEESILFYEEIIQEEKYNHSDRLAISHYRIFRATIGINAEENYKAVIRFEDFRKNLPKNFQLDALLQLSKVCLSLSKWNLTEQFADELRILATIRYQEELLMKKNKSASESLKTERPLIVYYGQSYLIKAAALFRQGHYEKAKQYIEGYEDLSWFEILDDQGKKEVEKFRSWAKANKYSVELFLGNISVLDEYTIHLTEHPNQIPTGLLLITKAANAYGFPIDHILERFPDPFLENEATAVRIEYHIEFYYQKAIYEFNQQRFTKGLESILYCLSLSIPTKRHSISILCAAQLELYQNHASDSQREKFTNLMK
ncbi:DNA-binding protein, partial [Paenibacillus larvae]|uniref:DNA-binding protein n=1 Tax=Paenibacillus larvae TaxID=1464 RepID=UPI00227E9E14